MRFFKENCQYLEGICRIVLRSKWFNNIWHSRNQATLKINGMEIPRVNENKITLVYKTKYILAKKNTCCIVHSYSCSNMVLGGVSGGPQVNDGELVTKWTLKY